MKIEKDYKEFFVLLNKHKVRYCIVGSYAVAFHAKPRYTKDIDIFIEPRKPNAKKIIRVLEEYGFRNLGIAESDFLSKGSIIQLGYEPVRIDLITAIQGCDFGRVWKNKCVGKYGKEEVYFIGLDDLIRNRKLAARHIDRSDLEILEKAKTK